VIHELFLQNSLTPGKRTLVIVGFGMGVWIGGLFTYRSFELAGKRHGAVSLITPGINKAEIISAIKNIGGQYEEIILTGYPPFVKDVLDEMREERVKIGKGRMRILFAAEPFGEGFRDHIARQAGITNVYRDTMNIYGSADIGAMAWESPFTILARRLALKNEELFANLFRGARKLPTLAQYHPDFIVFEEQGGELYLTGNNAVPLIRYGIGDHGGVQSYDAVEEMITARGMSIHDLLQEADSTSTLHKLPLVYVYERNDFSTTLYGLQIYPEVIREVLIRNPLQKFLTGKLTMLTTFDANHDQYLEIHLELRKNKKITRTTKERTLDMIVRGLRQQISEFRELHTHLKDRALPKLHFWAYGHPTYFKSGGKQKWVKHA
jgi:phenylacetate-CoA ligase